MAAATPPRGGGGTGEGTRKQRRSPRRRSRGAGGARKPPKRPHGRPKAQSLPPATPFPLDLLLRPAKAPSRATGARGGRAAGEGAQPAFGSAASPDVLCLPSPEWLRHTLAVSGPADALIGFRAAAAGAGAIPWRVPVAELEEGWFNLAVAAPDQQAGGDSGGVSAAAARLLAGQLAEAVRARVEALALLDWAGEERPCPLDLHALVPVPAEVLALGPDHPRAQRWLWEHWGTTWPLRGVAMNAEESRPARGGEGQRAAAGHGTIRFAFHSADWSPWRALERLRARWPALAFTLRPDYGFCEANNHGDVAAADPGATAYGPARRRCRQAGGGKP